MIESMGLQNQYTKEQAKAIFDEIDYEKNGKVDSEAFMERMSKSQINSAYNQFFDLVEKDLATPSDKIIIKLKKLKSKSYIEKDTESVHDIDWYVL